MRESTHHATPKRIAVFDDDLPFIRMVERILGESGIEVQPITTFDLGEATRVMRESGAELGLIDIFMYGDNAGFRLIERLRREPPTNRMPLIVTSGAIRDVERHADFLDEHGCARLLKPFEPDELLARVRGSPQHLPGVTRR